jgi:HlyD family secretion protein
VARLIRRLILVLLGAATLVAMAWALWPKPVLVDFATIARGPLEVTVEDEGITRIREIYTVSAPTGGKMLRAPREVGDTVTAGETVVAVFQPTEPAFLDARMQRVSQAAVDAAGAAVQLAEAQLAQARSQLEFLQGDLRRATELVARNAVSARTMEKARLDVATGEAAVASAIANLEVRRRELESARAQLIQPGENGVAPSTCCINVRAPVTGRVLKILVESEQVVQAGTPLMEIGDPADLEAVVELLSRDAVRVAHGAPARIESWGGETALNARVVRVEPSGFTKVSALGIEEQRVRAVLEFTDPPQAWQRLGHAFRIVARIRVWSAADEVLVPLGALFRNGDRWAVFAAVDGRAHLRPVEIAERDLRSARVVDGLRPGDEIILHPSDRIRDGARVARRH